jgi:glycosyltransferase involved in cell wall biosynthesis
VKRILLVTHYYAEHRGGVEIVAGKIAEQLALRGWKVTWAASGPAPTAARDGILRVPMRSWNFTEKRFGVPYPLWGPISLIKLCALVGKSEVVHLHDSLYFGNVIAYLCARLLRKPVVITQHIGPIPYTQPVLRFVNELANRTLASVLLAGCCRTVFISTKVRNFFSLIVSFRRGPVYIANGVSTNRFHPVRSEERQRVRATFGWPADKLVMLFVGRFVPKKNLALLRKMAAHFPAVDWMFVGWGPENPASWGLANVHCCGAVDQRDMPAYYQAADLLVLPSVGEGFPLVIQEAMACGLPALISADTAAGVPGIEAAVLVSDLHWDRLVSLIKDSVADPARLAERGAAGVDFARRHWEWDACTDRYEQVFAQATRHSS